MTTGAFLLVSALVMGFVLLAALWAGKPEPPKAPSSETTRWKRFRVHFGALHSPSREPATLVLEEPSGLKLLAEPRLEAAPRRWRVVSGGRAVIEMARGFMFCRDRLRVLLQGKDWMNLRPPKSRDKKPRLSFVSPTDALELQGNVAGREFEVRRKGRLIASVSWQRTDGDSSPRKDYVLEALKGEDPLPLLALVLAVEAAMGPAKG